MEERGSWDVYSRRRRRKAWEFAGGGEKKAQTELKAIEVLFNYS